MILVTAGRPLVLLVWAVAFAALPAAGQELRPGIESLFEVGWSITPQARRAADAQFEALPAAATRDPRTLKAWWLVLMYERRFDEALKQVDLYLVREEGDLSALRARAWLTTVLKNYQGALLAAERLSTQLAEKPPADDGGKAIYEESIAFLGRLFGYLGGPASDSVDQEQRKRLERRIVERIPESQRPLFEDARNGVLARYIEMTDESAATRERTQAAAAAEKAKTLADLQSEREKLDAESGALEEKRTKLNSELRAELSDIDRQELPLIQQQTQLGSRVDRLNTDLLNYSVQINSLEQLAAREKDNNLRLQYLNQASALALTANRIQADLYSVDRLLRTLQGQRASLQVRRNQAQASTAAQARGVNDELNDIDRRGKRNEGMEKRAARSAKGSTGKERSLAAQAAALSTYDVFPLEVEKARLLATFE